MLVVRPRPSEHAALVHVGPQNSLGYVHGKPEVDQQKVPSVARNDRAPDNAYLVAWAPCNAMVAAADNADAGDTEDIDRADNMVLLVAADDQHNQGLDTVAVRQSEHGVVRMVVVVDDDELLWLLMVVLVQEMDLH